MKNTLYKKITGFMTVVALLLFIASCAPTEEKGTTLNVTATNTATVAVDDMVFSVKDEKVLAAIDTIFNGKISVTADTVTLSWQLIDYDNDGSSDKLLISDSFGPEEEKSYEISQADEVPDFTKKTYAEISIKTGGEWKMVTKDNGKEQHEYQGGTFENVDELVVPEEHTDHSFFIRYEGPGWESDKVGYRFYLDWRNAVDIFGKKTTDMVLQDVGQDGFDSYHEPAEWGLDILKVGSSLGLGSLGYWDGEKAVRVEKTEDVKCDITLNGTLKSKITTNYIGWQIADTKVDLESNLSIKGGSRLTKEVAKLSAPLDNMCTGIVKHDNGKVLQSQGASGEWSYLATFGKQSIIDDNLGMVIFYRSDDLIEITEDEHSHVVVLKPNDNKVKYYFAATWEQDVDNIGTEDAFKTYLSSTLATLNNPVQVAVAE